MTVRTALYISALFIWFVGAAAAQAESSTAPVKWERYSVPDRKISLLLPKMPTIEDASTQCSEVEKRSYFAYADHSIYELVVAAKTSAKMPEWCRQVVRFGEEALAVRLNELREERHGNVESQNLRDGRPLHHFKNADAERWVIADLKNGRWVELAIHGRENRKANAERFLESLDLESSEGIKIGDGARTTLGDAVSVVTQTQQNAAATPSADQTPAVVVDNARVISRPRAKYTETARRANINGSVRVKVTLLPDGSVGAVTPVKEMSHGLTEQAISAARRLVFLPKRVNGVAVPVVQTVDYSFSIY